MVGSGACIPGDFPVGPEVDCPEPMLPGQNVVRKEGTAKREASGARALGSCPDGVSGKPGKAWMGSQEGRLCTDSNRELLKLILGTVGSSVLQGVEHIALERTEGICFVAKV